ncbi:bifunctional methylenetetrahydrofolate dehydrogenase/methenyltetrahydrofolate cyclohydrolase FolD [Intestinirhabdus alba]|jgi:methylenetetrahydrofolate dehydrogenase (NADP+)/methenyltetrahydrofolate cyclohydrolase|uniref:Bifunctional protein FolD n=1 Tax=Intestinirhabdus alba TaxID=2899544 RepID=A0A6L6IM71_9ENTR|nr:bifunctional methylenetetrahydrofolate dehydrogenase/methenyltetrahydrofolate cyclohydrolase FolD [Intestinirhabdus alba]MTH46957.1 bifunctional methylenetetrahydrofolate dehydrogenase/methenyltetrahydrofolate cyclohydrolase FolD [Intestinirhabdus alba]
MSVLLNGKAIAATIKEELKAQLSARPYTATLAVILVGSDPASSIYVKNKHRACEQVGIRSLVITLPDTISQAGLLAEIETLNQRDDVDGILVQLPLPASIDSRAVIQAISPAKDVDGFHPENVGALSMNHPGFLPCTPAGIIELLKRSNIEIAGKECVVLGRSNIVGKPVAQLLLRENATVTLCHSQTKHLPQICQRADILIVAIGKPRAIDSRYVKPGAVVVDVGIHRDSEGQICGDVDFSAVEAVAGAITPVPGGVGPMTIAMLMQNCLIAAERHASRPA